MPAPFSQRTLDILSEMKWAGLQEGLAALMEPHLRKLGHVMPPRVARFLDLYGHLLRAQKSPYQPGTVAFHTNPIEAAMHIHPTELTESEGRVGARLCPIGEAGYGFYIMLMDEHERVFAIDHCGVLTKWADSGEELIESLCTCGRMESVDETDRWPSGGESGAEAPPAH